MAKFGLITEGVTDQIVIENILCGFYKDYEDLDEEIQYLQPPFDETDKKQTDFSNWELLLEYLTQKRFRDDTLNSIYIIIQIDTDDSQHTNFDISPYDSNNQELPIKKFIVKVMDKLISKIDATESFYKKHQEKIIFAISVHSLECWILPIYNNKSEVIHKCFDKLSKEVPKVSKKLKVNKNYRDYDKLSRPFLKHKQLIKIASQNSSFQIFINKLPKEI